MKWTQLSCYNIIIFIQKWFCISVLRRTIQHPLAYINHQVSAHSIDIKHSVHLGTSILALITMLVCIPCACIVLLTLAHTIMLVCAYNVLLTLAHTTMLVCACIVLLTLAHSTMLVCAYIVLLTLAHATMLVCIACAHCSAHLGTHHHVSVHRTCVLFYLPEHATVC